MAGGGVDAQAQARGRGLAQNADSASGGTFCPEIPHTLLPSTPPALPNLAPWEAWNPGSFSGQKRPHDITSPAKATHCELTGCAARQDGKGASGSQQVGLWGAGASSAWGPTAGYPRLTCSTNRTLSR